jgi:branched-chain amino acid transport system permease protein
MGSLWGSLLGAGVLTCISEALHVAKQYHIIAYGVFLCLVLVFLPEGVLMGIINLFFKKKAQQNIKKANIQ